MNFDWLFELDNKVMFLVLTGIVTITGLVKIFLLDNFFDRSLSTHPDHNDFVIAYLSLTGAFLSITFGLIIVGTYETYNNSVEIVDNEVKELKLLYHDFDFLKGSKNDTLQDLLSSYANVVINNEWPKQQEGIICTDANTVLHVLKKELLAYQPLDEKDLFFYTQSYEQYKSLLRLRSDRLGVVNKGLHSSIYFILVLGLLVNMLISWQIAIENKRLEVFVYTFTGVLAGSLVFIIVALDRPFRGSLGVSAEPFKNFLENISQFN